MKKALFISLGLLTLYSVYLSALSVIHGEINFFNDVARDFLLLQELDVKKIVFIGPRSSTSGLFHGPLLTYIDYPAYLLSGGNPVIVGWFWIILGVLFLITSFFIAKKLFGTLPACVYALLLATRMVPHINGVFEPEAMYFVMPVFLFTIISYAKTKKWIYLATHLIAVSVFIQLSIGIGLQFLILTTFLALFLIFKTHTWKHLLSFLVVPVCCVNYILFDLRHNFMMARALTSTGGGSKFFITISSWIQNRVENTLFLQLFDRPDEYRIFLLIIFIILMVFTFLKIKQDKKQKSTYLIFLFYYAGYMVMSYFNKGVLLFHYVYLLAPLTYLWLVSFLRGKTTILFSILIGLIYIINLSSAVSFGKSFDMETQKNVNSWKGLSQAAQVVIKAQKGNSFGYFVFSPDAFAYQPRYAMIYNFKAAHARASEYVKKETTYVIAQPPPSNDRYMDYKWWVKVPVGITAQPSKIITLPDGYKVITYHLTPEEQKIPFDHSIEVGITFR